MSWNPYNQNPVTNPNFSSANVGEIATAGSDASTVPPAAPNRGTLNSEITVTIFATAAQQGTNATSGNFKTDYAGIPAAAVQGYKWF